MIDGAVIIFAGIMVIGFHPSRRAPRRCPDFQAGMNFLSFFDIAHQYVPVSVDTEIDHIEIIDNVVQRIEIHSEITGSDRYSAIGIVGFFRAEQIKKNFILFFFGQST